MGRRKRRGLDIDGLLLVDKPQGMTSFSLTEQVRRALNANKAGHTGTLDPMATGLMVICLGQGTKLVHGLTGQDKAYSATVRLGAETDSYDAEGEITATASAEQVAAIGEAEVAAALAPLRGTIEQRPPIYSAIKVDGQRLHARARAGEVVEVPTRVVTVHHLEMTGARHPDYDLEVACSKGTYIRSIAHDLGQALTVGGHLVALRRTVVGPWSVEAATPLDAIREVPEAAMAKLITLAEATAHLPTIKLTGARFDDVTHGRPISTPELAPGPARALDAEGRLRALLEVGEDQIGRISRGFVVSEASAS